MVVVSALFPKMECELPVGIYDIYWRLELGIRSD